MNSAAPPAAVSLDLDNQWTYLRSHGREAWREYPSFLNLAVPRILDFFRARKMAITFFIVGRDADQDVHREVLAQIANDGHEVGNHTYGHEPDFNILGPGQIAEEIARAEIAIERATGLRPAGFRGPAYKLCRSALEILQKRGYRYDATTFPTYLTPLAGAYQRFTSLPAARDGGRRGSLFDSLRDGARPIAPYRWELAEGSLLEVPVTTMPVLKLPIHLTYLNFLAGFSPWLAHSYFLFALRLCRATGVGPSLLLHATDFLGCDDVNGLGFLPGMKRQSVEKIELLDKIIADYRRFFTVLPLGQFAAAVESEGGLPLVTPRFTPTGARGGKP